MGMKGLLETLRAQLDAARAQFDLFDWSYRHVEEVEWLSAEPAGGLQCFYREQDALLRRGRLVWSQGVQANSNLFEDGFADSPAEVVFSLDPALEDDPSPLVDCAKELFRLKSESSTDPVLAELGRRMADERGRHFHLPLPPSLAGGHAAFSSVVMVARKHLPGHKLHRMQLPLLVLPGEAQSVMVLPARYWLPRYARGWVLGKPVEEPTSEIYPGMALSRLRLTPEADAQRVRAAFRRELRRSALDDDPGEGSEVQRSLQPALAACAGGATPDPMAKLQGPEDPALASSLDKLGAEGGVEAVLGLLGVGLPERAAELRRAVGVRLPGQALALELEDKLALLDELLSLRTAVAPWLLKRLARAAMDEALWRGRRWTLEWLRAQPARLLPLQNALARCPQLRGALEPLTAAR